MEKNLNFKQKLVVIAMDILLITELSFSIYLGHQDTENMTAVFLRTFIPLAFGTLVITKFLVSKLRSRN